MWRQDLQWRTVGRGDERKSTTRFDGHAVTVRHTLVNQDEIWVLDVDNILCCGQHVSRSGAMCIEAVTAAVANARARRRRPIMAGSREF